MSSHAPSGIPAVAQLAWGSHLTQFFESGEELRGLLVPYFKAGLENNERCLWVTDAAFTAVQARAALRAELADFDDRERDGQIEISDAGNWYASDAKLQPREIVDGLLRREAEALGRGYQGLRTNGNCAWVSPAQWSDFQEYEALVHDAIRGRRMICMCSYCLPQAEEHGLEILSHHDLAIPTAGPKSAAAPQGADELPPKGPSVIYHFAAIVESSHDAIISKDTNGIIQSWNRTAERLFGYTAEEIIGKSILTLIPPDRLHEEDDIITRIKRGERIEPFETVRRHKDGRPLDISVTISPVRDALGKIVGASKIARDISDKKQAERKLAEQTKRLETLYRVSREIARDLNIERIVQTVTDIATEVSEAKFGAFFYNMRDQKGEWYQLFALSGAPREAFERFGMPRNTKVFAPTFAGDGIVRSDDIRKDPRYGHNDPHFGMPKGHLPVVSYLAVPVFSSTGQIHGGLFFGHDQPGIFTSDCESLIAAIAAQAGVAMDNARLHEAAQIEIEQRKRAEEGRELLLNEIKHRVKNTLGTVQAMVMQTFKGAPAAEHQAFVARLHALASAHDLLTQKDWLDASVGEIVERAMGPFNDKQRVRVSGPDVVLGPSKSLVLAMLLHELGTNAVKYGSLSEETGFVDLTWARNDTSGRPQLSLDWKESGGPAVTPPIRKGFGTRMIERALQAEGGAAELAFDPAGLRCHIAIAR
jgi:PAS domain S-box-containing protein